MQTNAPKFIVWLIAVIIGGLGILAKFIILPVASVYSFWFVVVGFVILAVANILKGM